MRFECIYLFFIFSCLEYNLFILGYNSCKLIIQTRIFYITIDCEWIFKRFSNCSSIKYIVCRIKLHITVLCHWIYYTHFVAGVLFSVRKINIGHEIWLYYLLVFYIFLFSFNGTFTWRNCSIKASGILNLKMHFFFNRHLLNSMFLTYLHLNFTFHFRFFFQKISKCFQFIFWPPWQHVITFFFKIVKQVLLFQFRT